MPTHSYPYLYGTKLQEERQVVCRELHKCHEFLHIDGTCTATV